MNFTWARWEKVRESYANWWDGTSSHPLVKAVIAGDKPYTGKTMLLTQATCHDLTTEPDEVINRLDWELSQCSYLGAAFPMVNMDVFGPGVLAGFLGARLDNASGNVWFFPQKQAELSELHFAYDANNVWLNRIKALYHAAHKKWGGMVLMSMPDLGGVMDVLSVFRGADNLLMDLYDDPEELRRVAEEIHKLWKTIYKELSEANQCERFGYTDWSGIYSAKPSYILQCDFAYMIGPEMFAEFALRHIREGTEWLENSVYHLDGKGQIPHLDQLLELPRLDAVQWVPGDGAPPAEEWVPIYRSILEAGKKAHVVGSPESFLSIFNATGSPRLYYDCGKFATAQRGIAEKVLLESGYKQP